MGIKKDKVREKIVQEAASLFAKFGYKKTSMDEIALATRKGKTSIYYYFKNKEAVFQAVIEKEADLLREELFKSIAATDSPEEQLKAYIYTRMRMLENVSNLYDAMKNELLDHLEFMDVVREKYNVEEEQLVQAIIASGLTTGVFQTENVELTAQTLVTAMKGLEMPLFSGRIDEEVRRKVDELVRILFFGLVKR
ncbi:MAG: TetR/AcrR family transcriptional regulator [Bacteroidetes bacterium]|nr:TetR/AcrR family transcriptional regulator [Bacteroidota bacterium]